MLSLGVVAVVALARTVLACDLWDSSSLRISGLRQHPEYNGEYLRDRDVHQYPSFWQRDPENSCGTAMRKGDCGALEWQMLPAGNASESACLAACEAELQHGCCRFGPAPLDGDAGAVNVAVRFAGTAAPGGCALGHGNVVFEAVPIWSMVAACHGRAVVLQVDGIWRLTPPHVLDLTSAQERHSSYISIAEGLANQSLSEGFQRESAQGRPRRFVDADADVNLHCDEPKTSSSGFATWMLIVPIAAVVLCICGVFIFCHRMSKKEYAKTTAARDAARHRARWLREELQSVEASRGPGPSTAASKVVEQGPLRALQKEVQRFRKELDRLESKEQQRHLDPREEDEIDEARREAQQTAEELTARSLRLKQSEAALERQRAEVRAKAEEASLKKLEASTQKAECQRIQGEIIELQGEERTTLGRAQQLEREAASLAKAYERYKETCFVYGAAILRSSGPTSKLGNQDLERRPVRRGVDALIETLASRFGWPEVAFLRLDRRGSGRLGAQELRMGLLIGAAVDFPAITGLTAEALFSAIDWRSAGFITAADLAACRPDIWREFGAAALEVDEKVRALPWLALGGPRKAFQDATAHQNSSLKWSDFEMVLCERLRGLPKQEVQELFAKIAEKDLSDALVVSPASWEKITKEPAFRSGLSSDAPSLAH